MSPSIWNWHQISLRLESQWGQLFWKSLWIFTVIPEVHLQGGWGVKATVASIFNCFHLYFPTDLRTSAICRSTQRFTMRAQCTAVQWRVVIILVIRSKQWASTSRESMRFVTQCHPTYYLVRSSQPAVTVDILMVFCWCRLEEWLNINAISVIRCSLGVTLLHFTFVRSMSWSGPLDIPALGESPVLVVILSASQSSGCDKYNLSRAEKT